MKSTHHQGVPSRRIRRWVLLAFFFATLPLTWATGLDCGGDPKSLVGIEAFVEPHSAIAVPIMAALVLACFAFAKLAERVALRRIVRQVLHATSAVVAFAAAWFVIAAANAGVSSHVRIWPAAYAAAASWIAIGADAVVAVFQVEPRNARPPATREGETPKAALGFYLTVVLVFVFVVVANAMTTELEYPAKPPPPTMEPWGPR